MEDQQTDRVLVVDDAPAIRQALERSLRRLGYEVLCAADGEEALRLAVANPPQVILTDVRMPIMDGHTLLRRLKRFDLDAAVIVMSGHGSMDDVVDALRNGSVDYLKKPWTPSELISAVGRAVEIHDQRATARKAKTHGASPGAASGSVAAAPAEKSKAGPAFSTIIEQIRRGEIVLPPVPAILTELRSLLSKPEADMQEITSLVERDPRMVTQVLRITNSVQFTRGGRVNDIRTAVARIGLSQLSIMVQTVLLHHSHQATNATLRALQTRIWRYSIARAVSMQALAELAGGRAQLEPETAYLAGLLADTGASFLLWVSAERLTSGGQPPEDSDSYMLGLREQHQAVGAALLTRWGLDPLVVLTARTHHLEAPPAPPSGYWNLAVLGTAMADKLSDGDDVTRAVPQSPDLVDRCGAELRIGTSLAAKIEDSVRRQYEGVMEALA